MRYLNFTGMRPKYKSQSLETSEADVARNLDIGRRTLRGFLAPGNAQRAVAPDGSPVSFDFALTLHHAGGLWFAWEHLVSVAPDTAVGAASESFLFVDGGALWWQSPARAAQRLAPVKVGICPPAAPATALVLAGDGCDEQAPPLACVDPAAPPGTPCLPGTPEMRGYVYTYVRYYPGCEGRMEESAPSPITTVEVLPGDGVALTTGGPIPADVTEVRWYRSVPGTNGQVVWLYAGSSESPTFVDRTCAFELGEPLATEGHLPPPECLEGVAVVGDAMTVLWSGRRLWVSVPFAPHAYILERDQFEVTADIVDVRGRVGSAEGATTFTAHILTKGHPYRMAGTVQEKIDLYQIPVNRPCLGGVCDIAGQTGYMAPTGYMLFDGTRVESVTAPWIADVDMGWLLRFGAPSVAYHDDRLWMFWPERDGLVFVIDGKTRPQSMVTHTVRAGAALVPEGHGLHMAGRQGMVLEWGVGAPMRWTWRSAVEVTAGRWRPAAVKVVTDNSWHWHDIDEATLAFMEWRRVRGDGAAAQFVQQHPQFAHLLEQLQGNCRHDVAIYRDGRVVGEMSVHDSRPLRVARWPHATEWAIEVSGYGEVREVHLQTSIMDLAQDGGHA